jgi:hypothetical protein
MTTTESFQKLPDSYESVQTCKASRFSTNPRYQSFTQVHFTAGDKEQFETFRDPTNGVQPNKIVNLQQNIFNPLNIDLKIDWIKYKNLNAESVMNTFNYIFNKLKKGVFVKIKDNKLDVFLPFSKINFVNEWGNRINYDPTRFRSMTDFLIFCSNMAGYSVNPATINPDTYMWYANNSLLRYEFPLSENDNDLSNFKDMFETLCKEREVADIEFFINKRDFPVLKRHSSEPYEEIYGMEKYPLVSYKYDKYSPILSMVTTDNNADIPMPTWEDWARAQSQSKPPKFFDGCRSYDYNFNIPWKDKIPIAVFRGASTGGGTTVENNTRLKISLMSSTQGPVKLLDAGITKWNTRPRKTMNSPFLQTIEPNKLPFKLVNPLSPEEQSKYKYIINIDGHVSAFRLSLELSMGSVILLVESKYKLWFKKYLVENVHYISVSADLSDLFEKIQWCRENDDKCEEIAKNAKLFYDTYLKKDGLLDYMQFLLTKIKILTGDYFYNTVKVNKIIVEKQETFIKIRLTQNTSIKPVWIFEHRDFNAMDGLRLFYEKNGIYFNDKDRKIVHESSTASVFMLNSHLLFKKSSKINEMINETFIGLQCINKLLKEIPNFRYTWGSGPYINTLYCENIEGITLQKYIQNGCSIRELNSILILLCLALAVAQERIGLVHYDLYPWNIVIKRLPRPEKIVYRFSEYIFEIETDLIPVIIDYGKSHVISNKEHFGTIKPFETNTYQDCFSLVISCLHEMINKVFSNRLLYIINFFTENDFYKFKIQTQRDLIRFIAQNKKYDEMINGNKFGLYNINPVDLLFYLTDYTVEMDNKQNFYLKINQINYPEKIQYNIKFGVPLFYYDIISNIDPSKDIMNYVKNIQHCFESTTEVKNLLAYINFSNKIYHSINFVMDFIYKYRVLKAEKILRLCINILDTVKLTYLTRRQEYRSDLNIKYFNIQKELNQANYTPESFAVPEKILTIIQSYPEDNNQIYDMLNFREILIYNILYNQPYNMGNNEIDFIEKYGKYILISPLVYKNYIANIKTVKDIALRIYERDLTYLENLEIKPQRTIRTINKINDFF